MTAETTQEAGPKWTGDETVTLRELANEVGPHRADEIATAIMSRRREPGVPSRCDHGPDVRCFECATDDELAAAIPPFPA